jgi:hypothetical protein
VEVGGPLGSLGLCDDFLLLTRSGAGANSFPFGALTQGRGPIPANHREGCGQLERREARLFVSEAVAKQSTSTLHFHPLTVSRGGLPATSS